MSDTAETQTTDPETTWNVDEQRYELRVGGDLAGWIDTRRGSDGDDEVLALVHTEVLPEHQGQGLSSPLIRAALDDAAAKDLTVAPLCPAVERYLSRHDVPGLRVVDVG